MIVSVIIPVFNKEHSIERAILSVVSQNLDENEFEIIIIDDGSSDGSLAVCERYKEKYSNVKVISKCNEGVSSARNLGIKVAQGDYICFLDADDFLVPGSFRLLLSDFFSDAFDVIEYSGATITSESDQNQSRYSQKAKMICESSGWNLLQKEGSCPFSVWMKWVRRSFILNNSISFKNLSIAEDVLFNLDLYNANPKIRRTTVDCYRYVTYSDGNQVSKKRDELFMKKCVDSYMILFDRISQINRQFSGEGSSQQCLWPMVNGNLVPFTSRLLCSNVKSSEISDIYKKLLELNLFPLFNPNKQAKVCFLIIKNSLLFNFNRFIYSKCFVPYILPNLNRNFNILTILDPEKKKSNGKQG